MNTDWGDTDSASKNQDDFTEQVLEMNNQYNTINLGYIQWK